MPLRSQAGTLLEEISGVCEGRVWLLPAILLMIYVPCVLSLSQSKAMWHDELFTYYIAQAPSVAEMWSQVKSLDLNPPLGYLLTRWSFEVLGVSTLAARLPEILFFLIAVLALAWFAARRMGLLYASFAAALLLLSKVFDLALEARPYSLLLGFFALAMLGWQEAAEPSGRSRRLSIGLIALSSAAMLLSHIFAVPMLVVLVAGEGWRTWKLRSIDRPLCLALLVPFALTFLYVPMLRNHGHAIYPSIFQPTGSMIFDFYVGSVERELIALLLTALAVLLALGPSHLRGGVAKGRYAWFFADHEWVVIVGLLALPLVLMFSLMAVKGAFFPRYGASVALGVPLLAAALLARWTGSNGLRDRRAALLGSIVALLVSGLPMVAFGAVITGRVFHSSRALEPVLPVCEACQRSASAGPNRVALPLVDASGLTFLEMNHHEGLGTVRRLYYLTDPAASAAIAHANIFDRMSELVQTFDLRGNVVEYSRFTQEHPHFYVFGRYDYPEDWLLAKLVKDGADVRVLGRTSDGYRDNELYEVTMPSRVKP